MQPRRAGVAVAARPTDRGGGGGGGGGTHPGALPAQPPRRFGRYEPATPPLTPLPPHHGATLTRHRPARRRQRPRWVPVAPTPAVVIRRGRARAAGAQPPTCTHKTPEGGPRRWRGARPTRVRPHPPPADGRRADGGGGPPTWLGGGRSWTPWPRHGVGGAGGGGAPAAFEWDSAIPTCAPRLTAVGGGRCGGRAAASAPATRGTGRRTDVARRGRGGDDLEQRQPSG